MFKDLQDITLQRSTDCAPKQKDCTEWKIEAVVVEFEARQAILLCGHSSGVTNKSKFVKSHRATAAVKAASSESRNIWEIKNKWLDMKVDHKKDVSVQW